MKASGTAAAARHDRAHGQATPAAKPAARAAAKSVPAAVKKAATPVAARAAATAVATKSGPAAKKAEATTPSKQSLSGQAPSRQLPSGQPPSRQPPSRQPSSEQSTSDQTAETSTAQAPVAPATKPAPAPAAAKQPAETKPTPGKAQVPAARAQAARLVAEQMPEVAAPAATEPAPATPAQADPVVPAQAEPAVPANSAPRPPNDAARRPGAPGTHTGPITAPRIPAKAEVFHEGDHVVYPTHGVGKVERIATEEIAGHKLELIHITFEENRMTLRVPVAKARTAGLRKLATRKLFEEALNVLKGRARIKRTMWSRRAQEYEAKINSGDPLAIAEVVRDLHRNAGQPDQSFSERQIYEAAMERLAAELAALDKTDKATAATKLTDFLKTV
jgi:CarD family transcriptional regulator